VSAIGGLMRGAKRVGILLRREKGVGDIVAKNSKD